MIHPRFLPMLAAAGLAAAAPAVAPTLAQAHDYGYAARRAYADDCTRRIHDNGTTGALLGAAAGAVIGSNVAHHGGRTGGALIGAAAGAAVGSNIARSSTKSRCRGVRYRTHYRAYAPAYVGYGYAPPPPPPPVYDVYEGPHDRGLHRGWYKHHHDDDDPEE